MVLLHYHNYPTRTIRAVSIHLSVLFLLLATSSNQEGFLAQGRSEFKMQKEEGNGVLMWSYMIGSNPPRCKGKCLACGPCEAVQVPANPQEAKSGVHFNMNTNGRGDGDSNYKPMDWKCKCGDYMFNP